MPAPTQPSRRAVLKAAGAFVLAAAVPLGRAPVAAQGMAEGPVAPNLFLRIGADSRVTLLCKHFEMGQGVTTGLASLVAEELDADWGQMAVEFAPNEPEIYRNLAFGVMGTGGSTSIANSWEQMRRVGATARAMLVAAAAAEWGVPEAEIAVRAGVVSHPSGREARFGALAGAAMAREAPADVALKPPSEWRLIGTRLPRIDSPPKTRGETLYAMDIRRPGMLTAVVARPPRFGAVLAGVDDAAARAVPGVREVVRIPSGVAVVAEDSWSALKGRAALALDWDESQAETRSSAQMLEDHRRLAEGETLPAARRGDAAAALARAARVFEAEIAFPFLAHAPMEPLNCTIELTGDGAEIWAGSQLQSIDMQVAAGILGLEPGQIRIHTLHGGGSFGRRGNPTGDWVGELAAIAGAMEVRAPVHLLWTREDDIRGGYYRPMVLHRVRAGLDASGALSGWRHTVVCKSVFAGTPFEAMMIEDGVDHSSVEGLADTPYAIPDFAVDAANAETPVPVLWWRSVGHSHTAHAVETVIDELAHAAGRDPVEFRMGLLADHPRDRAVLARAAEAGRWGEALPAGRGRGVALHRSFGTPVAMVADVDTSGGRLRVERVVAAVDCGVAVNPDIVTAQIEGAIGFALSAVTRNAVTFRDGIVEQGNFDDYNPTRMSEMPAVEVHILPSKAAPTGIGEPGVPPLAPAIANAIFAATGKRLRSLPLDLAALG